MPAARSIWNGTITFGSVAIPVKLFSATSSHALRFREVRASDGATIEHRRIGEESGDEIDHADVEMAYDEGDGGQVVLTKEEIAAADGPRPKVIAIEHFVRAEQIDPVFYDKPYLVGAQEDGIHGYRVLLAALEKSDKVGIGRFVLRSRENLVAVRPLGGALGIQTMRFDDELVDKADLELPSLRKKPGDREVEMAGKLVEMLQGDWQPEEQQDTYRDAVMDLIERKRQGKKPKKVKRKPEDGGDLADALEASLAGGRGKRARKTSRHADYDSAGHAANSKSASLKSKSKTAKQKSTSTQRTHNSSAAGSKSTGSPGKKESTATKKKRAAAKKTTSKKKATS
jgi:DNA end-binding protein Ku